MVVVAVAAPAAAAAAAVLAIIDIYLFIYRKLFLWKLIEFVVYCRLIFINIEVPTEFVGICKHCYSSVDEKTKQKKIIQQSSSINW